MKIVKQFLAVLITAVLVAAGIGMASSAVSASSPFACGQTSLDLDASLSGTVSCDAGEDYIRWTFSGLEPREIKFGYGYQASQNGWAELTTNIQFTKIMWMYDDPFARNFVWVRYVDSNFSSDWADFDFSTYTLALGPEGAGTGLDVDFPYGDSFGGGAHGWHMPYTVTDNTTRLLEAFVPGSDKAFYLFREDLIYGGPQDQPMEGSVEIRLVPQGASSLYSTSPFYCSAAPMEVGGYRSSTHEVANFDFFTPGFYEHRPFLSLQSPDGITCEEGPNYIKWTFEKQSPDVSVRFGSITGLQGQAIQAEALYKRSGWVGGSIDAPYGRTLQYRVSGARDTGMLRWDIREQPVEDGHPTYTFENEFDGAFLAAGNLQSWDFIISQGDEMALDNMGIKPWHDNTHGYVLITAPNYVNTAATQKAASDMTATAGAALTGTAAYDLTGTAAYDLTGTAAYNLTGTAAYDLTATALAVTGTPTSSGDDGGGGGGGGDDDGGGGGGGDDDDDIPPTVTSVPTWTATSTRTPTATVTATGTGTATRTPTPGPSPTTTSTAAGGIATATSTAAGGISATATSSGGGTDYGATQTSVAYIVSTMTAAVPSGAASGASSAPFSAAASTPSSAGATSVAYSGPCSGYLRVLAYVDTNQDNIMARQGEGIEGVAVTLTDADYNVVSELAMEAGIVKFCIPDYLAGQMVYVDIPYLLRSGSAQAPRLPSQQSVNSPFGNSTTTEAKLQTIELFFKLDAPTLPLALP